MPIFLRAFRRYVIYVICVLHTIFSTSFISIVCISVCLQEVRAYSLITHRSGKTHAIIIIVIIIFIFIANLCPPTFCVWHDHLQVRLTAPSKIRTLNFTQNSSQHIINKKTNLFFALSPSASKS